MPTYPRATSLYFVPIISVMDLLNKKVIILSGFARGGTNIVWNILQSHPKVCSSIRETGQLFDESKLMFVGNIMRGRFFGRHLIDHALFNYKMLNLNHPENRYKSENEVYTYEEIAESVLCLKSVNNDIRYTKTLLQIYPDLFFILLVRNGYSLCDGYIRRGKSAVEAAKIYRQMAIDVQLYKKMIPNLKVIKFEDVVNDPFGISQELFRFAKIEPVELDKLRLKSKKVIRKSGLHDTTFGEIDHKYWFTTDTIHNVLDSKINNVQLSRLTPRMIEDFNHLASDALMYFGFDIIQHD